MADDPNTVLAGMQSRHYRIPDYAGICRSDHQKWPCDAHLALAAVEAVLKEAGDFETNRPERLVPRSYAAECFRAAIVRALAGKGTQDG